MKKDSVSINIILDKSGSMSNTKEETISGINSFIEEQKKLQGEVSFTLCTFSYETEFLYDFSNLTDVTPLTEESYKPKGYTALLDAVGSTITKVGSKLNDLAEEEKPEQVIFLIVTDGLENASKTYTSDKIKEMITHQQEKYNWTFTYMGANVDAFAESSKIGIPMSATLNYNSDSDGTKNLYKSVTRSVSDARNKVKKENFFD